MKLNCLSAVLLNLWVAGWVLAWVWATCKARKEARACPYGQELRSSSGSAAEHCKTLS